ncbi:MULTISPECIES: sigmaY antisigma factor component [Paenibacillus]|uniref:SigmaY antisigma factor component n=2 Tax=Paenibacillus TaxID=44249 RepID=A0ABU6DLJ3_9BACL|nr:MULTISPECIES: sigmaY antisigma factor component [Paenibacillus]MBA2941686.1 sigmaY antisigma factor component [Paenibacillus sp. CGMCC 1.16610]MCY9661489.1 sigmaY antisigma factor component [Paenibacillus anseongense]MEB4798649.1 sigmaY antisigma factor component [Paenibacillus chondroitinus]MVQ34205.1 sigmaY antisigma factor component [Paenibacillus anseongense]
MKHENWDALPIWAWIGIALILLVQSTWLFVDARKRSARYPWFWGIWGILQAPTPLIVYLFAVRKIHRTFSGKGN